MKRLAGTVVLLLVAGCASTPPVAPKPQAPSAWDLRWREASSVSGHEGAVARLLLVSAPEIQNRRPADPWVHLTTRESVNEVAQRDLEVVLEAGETDALRLSARLLELRKQPAREAEFRCHPTLVSASSSDELRCRELSSGFDTAQALKLLCPLAGQSWTPWAKLPCADALTATGAHRDAAKLYCEGAESGPELVRCGEAQRRAGSKRAAVDAVQGRHRRLTGPSASVPSVRPD